MSIRNQAREVVLKIKRTGSRPHVVADYKSFEATETFALDKVSQEAQARAAEDIEINSKIPDSASEDNKLADHDWVVELVNSESAYYITSNAAGDAFATREALEDADVYWSGGVPRAPTRNDYAVVQDYNGAQWRFIYTVPQDNAEASDSESDSDSSEEKHGRWEPQYQIETDVVLTKNWSYTGFPDNTWKAVSSPIEEEASGGVWGMKIQKEGSPAFMVYSDPSISMSPPLTFHVGQYSAYTFDLVANIAPGYVLGSQMDKPLAAEAEAEALRNVKLDKMEPILWADLKARRDDGLLVPGQQYRITDYVATTNGDMESRSANHPFDIIVTADDERTLNEHARAIMHETVLDFSPDTQYAVGDFCKYEGTVYKCIIAHLGEWNADDFTEESPYFYDCDLAAWNLEYCLDNDATRFAWSVADGQTDAVTATGGRGVIYRMVDEFNNDFPYDFKGIQFRRWAITEITSTTLSADAVSSLSVQFVYSQNGNRCFAYGNSDISVNGTVMAVDANTSAWYFTFDTGNGEDGSKNGYDNGVYGNKAGESVVATKTGLNNIVFLGDYCNSNTFGYGCYSNTFGYGCNSNTFGKYCNSNTFGNYCNSNTFSNDCYSNTFSNDCYSNTFGYGCNSNTFGDHCIFNALGRDCCSHTFSDNCSSNTFGYGCNSNTFGDNCSSNTFGDSCYYNTFGYGCSSNTFGDECYSNTFGNTCHSNTFGDNCSSNTFGNPCHSNTFGDNCSSNTFGDSCGSNAFGDGCNFNAFGYSCGINAFGYSCSFNTFGDSCNFNAFGDSCGSNAFGYHCHSNAFGDSCGSNTFGDECYYNTFGYDCYSNTFGNYCNSNTFGNGCGINAFGSEFIRVSFAYPSSYDAGTYFIIRGVVYRMVAPYKGGFFTTKQFEADDRLFYATTSKYYKCVVAHRGAWDDSHFEEVPQFGEGGVLVEDSTVLKSYYRYIAFQSGIQYVTLNCPNATRKAYYQNVELKSGIVGSESNPKLITDPNVNQTFLTTYKPANSQEISVP